jgi:hypothetical protein
MRRMSTFMDSDLTGLWEEVMVAYSKALFQHLAGQTGENKVLCGKPAEIQSAIHMVACRPAAKQRPRKKQIYISRYYVTASQTNVFERQQLYTIMGSGVFYAVRVEMS